MTDEEWLETAKQLFAYSPYSSKPFQRSFLRLITKNEDAFREARSFFPTGDSLYFASNSALAKFVWIYNYGASVQGEKEFRQKIDKSIDKKRKR